VDAIKSDVVKPPVRHAQIEPPAQEENQSTASGEQAAMHSSVLKLLLLLIF
jgi:hypothetical protein